MYVTHKESKFPPCWLLVLYCETPENVENVGDASVVVMPGTGGMSEALPAEKRRALEGGGVETRSCRSRLGLLE